MTQGLDWQTIHVPLAAGLNQKADSRALQPPYLEVCKDVQFDEIGGIQTRKPYAVLGANIVGGGTIANARRLIVDGDELLLLTKTTLYTWNAQLTKWVSKGTHLACKVTEKTVASTTGDQIDGDRAELSNAIVFAWVDGTKTWVAALDKTTGAVIVAPTQIAGGDTRVRPRLVALSTRILLLMSNTTTGNLDALAIDPADVSTGIAAATTAVGSAAHNAFYDVTRIIGTDNAIVAQRLTPTTSYEIFKITAALVVTASTKVRTCDGPIAVSSTPDGVSAQVIRANVTNIQGDLITISTLADVYTAQAVGTVAATPVNQIAAAHRSVLDGGQYRCYAFWSAEETTQSLGFQSKSNWVNTGNILGTQAVFILRLGVASRAFDYNGEVYFWGAFGGESAAAGMGEPLGVRAQLQNTYYLYRDDGFLVAKAAWGVGGGLGPSTGRVPGVALTAGSTTFSWCATERQIIELGGQSTHYQGKPGTNRTGYADRAPRDVTFTFDSDEARRAVRLGATLYIADGLGLLQYDGVGLTEVGFCVYPWYFAAVTSGIGILNGAYSYKETLRWYNARGEIERSTTATGEQPSPVNNKIDLSIANLHITKKTGSRAVPAHEIWRTKVTPVLDAPFYLTTSKDPGVLTGDNRYIANDVAAAFALDGLDNMTDATLEKKETNPENGGVLENLAPPAATIVIATADRLFLAGIAGEPNSIWYSKLRGNGEVAAFHDALTIDVPREGGDLTALAFQNETLIAFRKTAIYSLPGDGLDNLGNGQNYGPARIIASDVGAVNHESVALTPLGLIFESSKGWYLLDRGWNVNYIGASVADYDSDTTVAVHVVEAQHQVRILTTARMLIWDYAVEPAQWSEWTISDGLHAAIWSGTYRYLTTTGPKSEQSAYTSLTYGFDIEGAWIKLADLQGFGRVRWFDVLGAYRSTFLLRIRVARDYKEDGAGQPLWFDDKAWTPSPTVVGSALQVRHTPSQQQCQAIKVRLTAYATLTKATFATLTGFDGGAGGGAIATSGVGWTATLTSRVLGTDGNTVSISVYVTTGDKGIEVRDHEKFDGTTWAYDFNNVGVRVGGTGAQLTVKNLEDAINDLSRLVEVTTADGTPTKTINDTNKLHGTATHLFTGGAQTLPTGEAAKLTGLGFELGFKRGIYRNLPSAQQQ